MGEGVTSTGVAVGCGVFVGGGVTFAAGALAYAAVGLIAVIIRVTPIRMENTMLAKFDLWFMTPSQTTIPIYFLNYIEDTTPPKKKNRCVSSDLLHDIHHE